MIELPMSNHVLSLVIQPADLSSRFYLLKLGFQPILSVPQLLYQILHSQQIEELVLQVANLPETLLNASRFMFLKAENLCTEQSLFAAREILLEFLNAQPLSELTKYYKYRWFLERLEQQHFFFKYQPIFNLKSKCIVGHECLIRTISDQDKSINGGQILEAAIVMNLTQELDELARKICIQSLANFDRNQTFFINIMPNAIIKNPHSLQQNIELILNLGLQPQQIVFELTELEKLQENPTLAALIKQIQKWGVKIAIDDLCSSTSVDHYFMELQPDIIKIDRQIIHQCSHSSLKQILISSLLGAAHKFGIFVVAEGLEEPADIECCRDLGIDFGQGFGLGLPELLPQDTEGDCNHQHICKISL